MVTKPSRVAGLGPTLQAAPRVVVRVPMQHVNRPPPAHVPHTSGTQKLAAGLLGAALGLTLALAPPAFAKEGFLKSTGARGVLAEEEMQLIRLRDEMESQTREELNVLRSELAEEARAQQAEGKLCATPFGIDVVGITEFVALTGALVGGISARRRKQELEKLNEQLRTINAQLRQQARAGTLFAPGLTYAPVGGPLANGASDEAAAAAAAMATTTLPRPPVLDAPIVVPPTVADDPPAPSTADISIGLMSLDEEDNPEVKQCQQALKEGKRLLKDRNAGPAMVRFEKALMLAKHLGDKVRQRRAVRGLAAAARIAGQSRMAITHLERVLEISREIGEYTGDADAYGTIADVYADIGEFEKAAEYYDKYINRMNSDGPV